MIAASQWKEFLVLYHLRKLRVEASHFEEVLHAEQGSAARMSLYRFLKTPAGAERLVGDFLEELGGWYLALWPRSDRLASLRRGLFGFGESTTSGESLLQFGYSIVGDGNSSRYSQSRQIPERLLQLWALVPIIEGHEVVIPTLPDLRFIVLAIPEAEARSRLDWPLRSPTDGMACVLERIAKAPQAPAPPPRQEPLDG